MIPHLRLYDLDPTGDPSEVFNTIDEARGTFRRLPETVACSAEVQCRRLESAVHEHYTPPDMRAQLNGLGRSRFA